jgi:hypothetical protein
MVAFDDTHVCYAGRSSVLREGEFTMDHSKQRITTFLMFDSKAEEEMNYYVSVFGQVEIVSIQQFLSPPFWLHQLLKDSLLSLAQAATERGQQVKPHIGVVLKAMAQEPAEFPQRQLQHSDLIYRRDRRRARQII